MSRQILTSLLRGHGCSIRSRATLTFVPRRYLGLSAASFKYHRGGNSNNGGGGDDKFDSLFEFSRTQMSKAKKNAGQQNVNQLFKPLIVKPNPDDINLGEEIVGVKLEKPALLRLLHKFNGKNVIRELAKEHGLDNYLYNQVSLTNCGVRHGSSFNNSRLS